MKLSIWRQFSSNHSGFFMIIGAFEQLDQAEAAYNELRQILFDIDRWHRENPEESARLEWERGPMPPEREIAARYDVPWPIHIDWTNWAQYHYQNSPREDYRNFGEHALERTRKLIDEAVVQIGNLVFISNPDQTWMTSEPFAGLIRTLGASPVFAADLELIEKPEEPAVPWDAWGFRLKCSAPDDETARKLVDVIQPYLDDTHKLLDKPAPPWDDFEANFERALHASSVLETQRD